MATVKKPRKSHEHTWRRLDSTAHIFPLVSNSNYSNVFRMSVVLKETINPDYLQEALEGTLPWFPHFQSRIRRGVFWYYFEKNQHPIFQVEEESSRPCSFIDLHKNEQYLFKVLYFNRRITLEVFHVLTDGTGAVNFLKALTANYLRLVDGVEMSLDHEVTETLGDIEDSYKLNYKKRKKSKHKIPKAYVVSGKKLPMYEMGIFHGYLSSKAVKDLAKSQGLSITMYLAAVYLWAIYESGHLETSEHKPIQIAVPVNLRPYFKSTTSMNFYSYITISLKASDQVISFEDIASLVSDQFKAQIDKELFLQKISMDVEKSRNIVTRLAPRFLKYIAVNLIYNKSMKAYTSTLSNIGIIGMPERFSRRIHHFEMMLNPTKASPIKLAVAGFEDKLILSFTSQLVEAKVQKAYFRKLAEDGLTVSVESNGVYYEEL